MPTAYVYPADTTGVGHYRLVWPAEAVRAEGWRTVVSWPGDEHSIVGVMAGNDPAGLVGLAQAPADADVVVLQRVTSAQLARAIPHLQARGIAVVVDVDDDFGSLPRSNPVWWLCHPKVAPHDNPRWLEEAAAAADLVTASTPALARRYGGHGRVMVLPNRLPAHAFDHPHVDDAGHDPLVGYAGAPVMSATSDTAVRRAVARLNPAFARRMPRLLGPHVEDFAVLADLFRRWDGRFRIVGPGERAGELVRRRQLDATGPVPFDRWFEAVSQLDVGLVPLAPGPFAEAKSALKGLEYAACGIPWIATATGPYRALHEEHGVGVLVERPRDWERAVRSLRDPVRRAEAAEAAREAGRVNAIDRHAGAWAEAWAQAIANRRRAPAPKPRRAEFRLAPGGLVASPPLSL